MKDKTISNLINLFNQKLKSKCKSHKNSKNNVKFMSKVIKTQDIILFRQERILILDGLLHQM